MSDLTMLARIGLRFRTTIEWAGPLGGQPQTWVLTLAPYNLPAPEGAHAAVSERRYFGSLTSVIERAHRDVCS